MIVTASDTSNILEDYVGTCLGPCISFSGCSYGHLFGSGGVCSMGPYLVHGI